MSATFRCLCLLLCCGCLLASEIVLHGRLEAQRSGDAGIDYHLDIGERRYWLLPDALAAEALADHRRDWVRVSGTLLDKRAEDPEREYRVDVTGTAAILPQRELALTASVTVEENAVYLRDDNDAVRYLVADRRDARELASYDGLLVSCEGYLIADDEVRIIDRLRDIQRQLRPGERPIPRSQSEALAGHWQGHFQIEESPIAKMVDKTFGGDFTIDGTLKHAVGTVVGMPAATFSTGHFTPRTREVAFTITVKAGDSIRCRGTFSPDWSRIEGTWQSGYLGNGTFAITYQP